MRARRLLCGVALAASACTLDEAALIDPGTRVIHADVGQIRVLRSVDDPTAGDRWIDVLGPVEAVVVEQVEFRQAGSHQADEDERADRRRVFEAVGAGTTVVVEMNCADCASGVPEPGSEDIELQVWHFVVGDDPELRLGPTAAARDLTHKVAVGDHVVVVRRATEGPGQVVALDSTVLLPLTGSDPSAGPDLYVDVYVAVADGETDLTYRLEDGTEITYPVAVD